MDSKQVSPNGYSDDYGPNVSDILFRGTRVIKSPVPRSVRNELMLAVKDGVLGHLKKEGLKPEIFFHPAHKNGATELQQKEAVYSINLIAKVTCPTIVDEVTLTQALEDMGKGTL